MFDRTYQLPDFEGFEVREEGLVVNGLLFRYWLVRPDRREEERLRRREEDRAVRLRSLDREAAMIRAEISEEKAASVRATINARERARDLARLAELERKHRPFHR